MTIARELAEFLTRTSVTDLPGQAVEHAAMLVASTIASAAMGSGLESSAIIRSLAQERGAVPAAIALGYEAAGRIGEAITPAYRARGFHGCLVAIFGGAVAAGRLLQLDAARL